MKKLIIINGTMGVGKSTVSKKLKMMLSPSVFLDGDWCWDLNPFTVTEENKDMVTSNIDFLLRSFLSNSGIEYVIFCWVIHEEDIFTQILEPLRELDFELFKITLTCSENALRERLSKDVAAGIRENDILERSTERLPLYENMDTIKIDVSELSAESAAKRIYEIVVTK
jgi:Predicted nucleotide kinase (related to CMP and AMP kinases)